MRIVYLNPSGQLGGAERALLDVMESVRKEAPSWPLTLVSSRPGPLLARASELGVDARVVSMPESVASLGDAAAQLRRRGLFGVCMRTIGALGAVASYRRQLRRSMKQLAPDVVHSNGYKMHIMGALTRPTSAALVWHLHDYASSRPLMSHAIRILSPRCDVGVAVSRSVADDVSKIWRGPRPIQVMLNAVDLETFRPDGRRADLDELSGMTPAEPNVVRVGLVATMGRFKGHDVFLRALAQLPRDLPVRGYIVGGALYETQGSEWTIAELRAMTRDLGIADRVGFTGFTDRPADAMRALDVVVHATTGPEPFGLVIAEGMACGKAVITSAAGGAGEITRAEVDALTHTPGNAGELAAAIVRLVRDPELRRRLGDAGRERAVTEFNRDRLGPTMVGIYRAAARHRGLAGATE